MAMVHVLLQYGRHNGHADFLREGVDGPWAPESAGTTDSRTMALEALVARSRSSRTIARTDFSVRRRLGDKCQ